ncbi:MAG: hypothetical protein CMP23_10300 [Rickettsiales bacterium]|nr:hypothetical protein [Rickettsiales bacterium]|tara:strand:+ start:1017 stop:1409 length:393 start_codon:yes stop_codon:yes gene_type:complete
MKFSWIDQAGTIASATCAAHCLLLSVAPALLSLLGLELLKHEALEWGLFAIALSIAGLAGALGYRVHRSSWVLGSFGVGIAVLVAGRMGEALELYEGAGMLAIVGGLLLVASHLKNIGSIRACQEPCCDS